MLRSHLRRLARRLLVAVTLMGAAIGAAAITPDALAQTAAASPRLGVGTELTAKVQHSLPGTGKLPVVIKLGTTGKVTRVYRSGGKVAFVDVQVGSVKAVKLPVAKIHECYRLSGAATKEKGTPAKVLRTRHRTMKQVRLHH